MTIAMQGAALKFIAHFYNGKVGATGLTVSVDVYENDAVTPIITGASATEIADGAYWYELAGTNVDADGIYWAVFSTADANVDKQEVLAYWTVGQMVNVNEAAIADQVWDEQQGPHNVAGSFGLALTQYGSSLVAVSADTDELQQAWADGGRLDLLLDAVLEDTNELQSTGFAVPGDPMTLATDAVSASALSAGAVAEIQSGLATTADLGSIPTAGENADAVWNEFTADHQGAGTTGLALTNAGAAGTPPTATENAAAVWDALLVDYDNAGSFGEAMAAAGAAGDPWITPLPGAYGAGTAGHKLGNLIGAPSSNINDYKATGFAVPGDAMGLLTNAITSVQIHDSAVAEIQAGLAVPGDQMELVPGAINSAALADGAIDSTKFAPNAIDASVLASDAVDEIAAATWDRDLSLHQVVGSAGNVITEIRADANHSLDEIADAVASRSFVNVEDSADPLSLAALGLFFMRAGVDGVTGDIIAYKSDLTEFHRYPASFDAAAEPIISVGI